ncbi:MAG: class I SAM-dependent methyltransferase [Azospirillaceae bacterium]
MTPDLLAYTRAVGAVYGTEDLGPFLYALARMQRPRRILDLGTGLGTTAFWLALACRENGQGSVLTFDDGSHWVNTARSTEVRPFLERPDEPFGAFIARQARRLGVDQPLRLVEARLPPFPTIERPIDLLLADFAHGPADIVALLAHFLPQMAPAASLFIDSASTYLPSYLLLEQLVGLFNRGQVPAVMLEGLDETGQRHLERVVATRRFILVHLTEVKDRAQNSTAWLKIEPIDLLPHPRTAMRQ